MKIFAAGILLFTSIALAENGPLSLSPEQFKQYLQSVEQQERQDLAELQAKLAAALSKPSKGDLKKTDLQTASPESTTPTSSEDDDDESTQALDESLRNEIDAKKSNIEYIKELSADENVISNFNASFNKFYENDQGLKSRIDQLQNNIDNLKKCVEQLGLSENKHCAECANSAKCQVEINKILLTSLEHFQSLTCDLCSMTLRLSQLR